MSIFNPQVPDTQDPRYIGLSKPIEDYAQKSVLGMGLSAAGDIFAGAIKGADQIVDAFARQSARDKAEPEREMFIDALKVGEEAVNSKMAGMPVPAENSGASVNVGVTAAPTDVMSARAEATLPPGMAGLPSKLGSMASAKAAGKVPEVYFYGRMTQLAKDVRSQYPPGYRDAIDAEFAKYSGGDPANHYIRSVLSMLNAARAGGDDELKHVLTQIRRMSDDGHPQAEALYQLAKGGGDLTKIQGVISEANRSKYDKEVATNRIATVQANQNLATEAINATAQPALAEMATRNYSMQNTFIIDKLPKDPVTGAINLTPAQAEETINSIRQNKDRARQEMFAYWTSPRKDLGGKSYADISTDKEFFPKAVESNLKIFDLDMESVTNEKYGTAQSIARQNKYIQEIAQNNIYKDRNLGWYATTSQAIQKIAPELSQKLLTGYFDKHGSEAINAFVKTATMDLVTNNWDPTMPAKSLQQTMKETKATGITIPTVYDQFLSLVDDLVTSKDEAYKLSIARALANPDNKGLIQSLNKDYRDSQGKYHPGQEATFNRLTSQGVIDTIYKLNEKDPTLVPKYKDWVLHTHQAIFGTAMKDFNSTLTEVPAKGVIKWNDKTNQFSYDYGGISNYNLKDPRTVAQQPYDPRLPIEGQIQARTDIRSNERVSKAINQINATLEPVTRVVEKDKGEDVGTYLMRVLQASGTDLSKVQGLPTMIRNSIDASKRKEETIKKMKKEDQR